MPRIFVQRTPTSSLYHQKVPNIGNETFYKNASDVSAEELTHLDFLAKKSADAQKVYETALTNITHYKPE